MEESSIGSLLESLKMSLANGNHSPAASLGTLDSGGAAQTDCNELLDHATPTLFRRNLFRVLGLPVDATPADVRKQQKRLEMQRKLGVSKTNGNASVLSLKPPPDDQEILAAMDRLNDPQLRLLDELFWFWPISENVADDAPLCALQEGEIDQAVYMWERQATEPGYGHVARHNLAVLGHLRALDYETAPSDGKDTDLPDFAKMWSRSIAHWREILDSEDFWGRLKRRVREMDDASLTTGFVRRLRHTLPKALLLINAQIALSKAENKRSAAASKQIAVIREANFPNITVEDIVREALMPVRRRVKAGIEGAKNNWTKEPRLANQFVRDLHKHSLELIAVVEALLPKDDFICVGLHDMVAEAMSDGTWAFARKTDQWQEAAGLLELARSTAGSEGQKSKQAREIETLKKNAESGNDWCASGYWDLPKESIERLEAARELVQSGKFDAAIDILAAMDASLGKPLRRCMAHTLCAKATQVVNLGQTAFVADTAVMKKLLDKLRADTTSVAMLLVNQPNPNSPSYLNPKCPCCGNSHYTRWRTFTYKELPMWFCNSCAEESDRERNKRKTEFNRILTEAIECLLLADELDPKDPGTQRNLETAKSIARDVGCSIPTTKAIRARLNVTRRTKRQEVGSVQDSATTCHFCGRGVPDTASQILVPMCSNVQKSQRLMGDQISWVQAEVCVPRCASCHHAHKEFARQTASWEQARNDSESAARFSQELAGLSEYTRELEFARYPHSGALFQIACLFSSSARKRSALLKNGNTEKEARTTQLKAAIAKSKADFRSKNRPPALPQAIQPESAYRTAQQLKRRESNGWGYGLEPNDECAMHKSVAEIETQVRGLVSTVAKTPTSESAEQALQAILQRKASGDGQLALFAPPSPMSPQTVPAWKAAGKILFSFKGRIQRSEFFLGMCGILGISLLPAAIIYFSQPQIAIALYCWLGIFALVMILAVLVKRMHDRNRSGGFVACMLIPYWQAIHLIWMFVECCRDGTIGPNRFGEDPKRRTMSEAPRKCFFCGTGEPASGSGLEVNLYNGTAANFKTATERVSRCKECADRHHLVKKISRRFGWCGAGLLALTTWLIVGWSCSRNSSPDDRLPAFLLAGLLPGLFIAGPVGAWIVSNIGRFVGEETQLYCIKPFSIRHRHPSVYKRLADGWKVGKKPRGAK